MTTSTRHPGAHGRRRGEPAPSAAVVRALRGVRRAQSRALLQRGGRDRRPARRSRFRYAVGIADGERRMPRPSPRRSAASSTAAELAGRWPAMTSPAASFPGGTSVIAARRLRGRGAGRVCGGSPHMHLVSTECYIVIGGRGGAADDRRRRLPRDGAARRVGRLVHAGDDPPRGQSTASCGSSCSWATRDCPRRAMPS